MNPSFPSLGCGVFGSKIVLAGGLASAGRNVVYNYDQIVYNMVTILTSLSDVLYPVSEEYFHSLVRQLLTFSGVSVMWL